MRFKAPLKSTIRPFSKLLVLFRVAQGCWRLFQCLRPKSGNTLDGWPVQHKANTQTDIFKLTPMINLVSPIYLSFGEATVLPTEPPFCNHKCSNLFQCIYSSMKCKCIDQYIYVYRKANIAPL